MTQFECDAILFDLDGVLIDSTSCIVRHWGTWARRHGLDVEAVMQVAHGFRTIETMRRMAPHLDVEREAERFTAGEVADTEGVVAIEGAVGLLTGLPDGVWTIVTSGGQALARARLSRAGLPIPATLVGGDDVRQGKPAPDPYLLGAIRLNVPPEQCLVVEDSPAGIAAAQAAGMRVIGVASTHPRHELECTAVVDRLLDLSVLVARGDGLVVHIQADSN